MYFPFPFFPFRVSLGSGLVGRVMVVVGEDGSEQVQQGQVEEEKQVARRRDR